MSKTLVIMRCSRHDVYGISIDDANGGTRVTPSKCCGSWPTVKEWTLRKSEWLELSKLAAAAAKGADA